ncbi:hypothetical protein Godav_000042 [Gossypium davidsonii]|uniref:Uncharacterized protein n=1 Tax=Gossypium davidsonii TaxID=34287 RepID=A0A7J8TI39_GOSDV|nr:hypothetical protein [Gossypium davidsonii]
MSPRIQQQSDQSSSTSTMINE